MGTFVLLTVLFVSVGAVVAVAAAALSLILTLLGRAQVPVAPARR